MTGRHACLKSLQLFNAIGAYFVLSVNCLLVGKHLGVNCFHED